MVIDVKRRNIISEEFVKELEGMGISREDIEGIRVRIGSNGTVTVDGIEDETVREQVQNLVEKSTVNKMYQYYIGIADSVGNLPYNAYRYATDIQEVRRYLKGVTGADLSLADLYMMPNGKIGGLPPKADNLINNTKNNAKIEQMRDALDGRLTPQYSGNMYSNMYKYQFRKVL